MPWGLGAVALAVVSFILSADTGERSPIAALRRSAQITHGERIQLFGLGIVLLLLNLIGLAVFLVGVLVTSAISLLAVAQVYRRLSTTASGPATSDMAS